jgi:hypothetical protein
MGKSSGFQGDISDGFASSLYQKQNFYDYTMEPHNPYKNKPSYLEEKAAERKWSDRSETNDNFKGYRSLDHNRYQTGGNSYTYNTGTHRTSNRYNAVSSEKDKLESRYQKYVKSKDNKSSYKKDADINSGYSGYTTPQKYEHHTIIS